MKFKSEKLSLALSGVSNTQTYKNFASLAELNAQRKELPFLFAATLLIPGYISPEEVEKIARFIASIDPSIPYSLLAFYPCFVLTDLPQTPRKLALECREAALKAGLKKVDIGNVHLLT